MLARTLTIALAAVVLALAGCEAKLNDDNVAKVTVGMSLSEVERLLGKGERDETGGVSISSGGVMGGSNAANSARQTYMWKEGDRQVVIEFKDMKVLAPPRKIGF